MDIILKSLGAAVITAMILILEKYSGPRIAGALGGIPIVFAVSFVLITMHAKDIVQIREFLIGGTIGAIAGIVFCLLLLFLNTKFLQYYWINFIAAYLVCFLFALFVSQAVNKS